MLAETKLKPLVKTNLKPLPTVYYLGKNATLTVHDLPPLSSIPHWVPNAKKLILDVVENGLLTLEEVIKRYEISREEFVQWQTKFKQHGLRGLLETKNCLADSLTQGAVTDTREPVVVGDLRIDFAAKRASVRGEEVALPPLPWRVIEFMAMHQGKVVSKQMFREHLHNMPIPPSIKLYDVVVCNLRKTLRQHESTACIQTVWGRGHKLCVAEVKPPAR